MNVRIPSHPSASAADNLAGAAGGLVRNPVVTGSMFGGWGPRLSR